MKMTFSVILSKQINPFLVKYNANFVTDEWRMDNTSYAYEGDVRITNPKGKRIIKYNEFQMKNEKKISCTYYYKVLILYSIRKKILIFGNGVQIITV